MTFEKPILGVGIYTPREAARYVGANSQSVLRWTRGSGALDPLWHNYFQELNDDTELSFRDLIEILVVSKFRAQGVSMQKIRYAIELAREEFQTDYPLSHRDFYTDGERILVQADGESEFTSLDKRDGLQRAFREIVAPSLQDVEFNNATPNYWRPSHGRNDVVLDPSRSFGTSILDEYGISTSVLRQEFDEFKNVLYLSEIYEIPAEQVISAIDFEYYLDGKDPIRPQFAA